MDLEILVIFIWLACALLVAFDSVMRGISPIFWRLAGLVGCPFGLLAYGIVRELRQQKAV